MPTMLAKDIVPLLLCSISKKLPHDPVETCDGDVYEKNLLESELKRSNTTVMYHRSEKIKQIIEKVLASGEVDDQYVGSWAKTCSSNDEDCHSVIDSNLLSAKVSHASDDNNVEKESMASIINKAQAGNTKCMVMYGEHLLAGTDGAGRDEKKGYEWFERAAGEDYGLGIARMADCLLYGIGVEKDYHEAYELLTEQKDSGR